MTKQEIVNEIIDEYTTILEKHGIKHDDEYHIDPSILPKLFVEQVNDYFEEKLTYTEIKNKINSVKLELTIKDITNHLNIKKQNIKGKYNNLPLEEILIKKVDEALELSDEHLDYYKKSIEILKEKNILILTIIEEMIRNKVFSCLDDNIKNILQDLDITIDNNGYILYQDSNRILTALFENTVDLLAISSLANNLETYYETNRYKNKKNIIPNKDLQIKDLATTDSRGYIRLSKKQYDALYVKSIDNFQKRLKYKI